MTFTEAQIEEAPADPPRGESSPGVIVAVLAAAGILVSLAQTLVVPIIGSLPEIFGTSASNTSWIITVTLLAGAVSTPVIGRLADMHGKRRMLVIAVVPFLLGSVVCAMATTVGVMIVGRALQGLASGMVPLGISLLHDLLPKDRAGSAIALMSSSMGIGGALGLPLAAAVAEFANWRVLFWATSVAAAVVTVAIWRWIPARHPVASEHRFDYLGAIGLAVGLIALLLAVSKGSQWGWGGAATIACFLIAIVAFVLWARYEWRRTGPLVDLRTTVKPVVLLTNIASILVGFAMYAMNLIVPQVMQLPIELGYGLGRSMFEMGLWIAPMGVGMMAVSTLGAWISRTRGPRVTLTLAGVVIAAGYGIAALVLATLGNRTPGGADGSLIVLTLVLVAVGTTISGCGVGLAFGAMPALIMGAVPAGEKAAANGFNSLMRSVGTTASAAVIGAVLASMVQQVSAVVVPTLTAFIAALLIGCGSAIVAAVIAATIPTRARVEPMD